MPHVFGQSSCTTGWSQYPFCWASEHVICVPPYVKSATSSHPTGIGGAGAPHKPHVAGQSDATEGYWISEQSACTAEAEISRDVAEM